MGAMARHLKVIVSPLYFSVSWQHISITTRRTYSCTTILSSFHFCRCNLSKPLLFSCLALYFPSIFLYVLTTYLRHETSYVSLHYILSSFHFCRYNISQPSLLYIVYTHGWSDQVVSTQYLLCILASYLFTAFLSIHFVARIISLSASFCPVAAICFNRHYYLSVDRIVVFKQVAPT